MLPEALDKLIVLATSTHRVLVFQQDFNDISPRDMQAFEALLIKDQRFKKLSFDSIVIHIKNLEQKPEILNCLERILSHCPHITGVQTLSCYSCEPSPLQNIINLVSLNRMHIYTSHSKRIILELDHCHQNLQQAKDKSIDLAASVECYRLFLEKLKQVNHYNFKTHVSIARSLLLSFTQTLLEKTANVQPVLPALSSLLLKSCEGENWGYNLSNVCILMAYVFAVLGSEQANTILLAESAFTRYFIPENLPEFDSFDFFCEPLFERLMVIHNNYKEKFYLFINTVKSIANTLKFPHFHSPHLSFLTRDAKRYKMTTQQNEQSAHATIAPFVPMHVSEKSKQPSQTLRQKAESGPVPMDLDSLEKTEKRKAAKL